MQAVECAHPDKIAKKYADSVATRLNAELGEGTVVFTSDQDLLTLHARLQEGLAIMQLPMLSCHRIRESSNDVSLILQHHILVSRDTVYLGGGFRVKIADIMQKEILRLGTAGLAGGIASAPAVIEYPVIEVTLDELVLTTRVRFTVTA